MWHASEGNMTFSGSYGLMLAHGIRSMVDKLVTSMQFGTPYELGCKTFDSMTEEQKIWTLQKVAFGLLDENTTICELYAYLEATVAGIFQQLDRNIRSEIVIGTALGTSDENISDGYFWRRIVHTAYESKGYNEPEYLDEGEKLLAVECTEPEEWKIALDVLEDDILWDNDFALDFFYDMPPGLRQMSSMNKDYYTSIPGDPKREDATALLKATSELCDLVIIREMRR